MNPWGALLTRELRLAVRHPADTLAAVLFFVLVAALFPFGVGPAPETLARIAPGALLAAALLAALLPLDRLFGADAEDGTLDQLLLSGLGPSAVAAAKAVAHWLTTGLPLLLATPIAAAMLNLPVEAWGAAMAARRRPSRRGSRCRLGEGRPGEGQRQHAAPPRRFSPYRNPSQSLTGLTMSSTRSASSARPPPGPASAASAASACAAGVRSTRCAASRTSGRASRPRMGSESAACKVGLFCGIGKRVGRAETGAAGTRGAVARVPPRPTCAGPHPFPPSHPGPQTAPVSGGSAARRGPNRPRGAASLRQQGRREGRRGQRERAGGRRATRRPAGLGNKARGRASAGPSAPAAAQPRASRFQSTFLFRTAPPLDAGNLGPRGSRPVGDYPNRHSHDLALLAAHRPHAHGVARPAGRVGGQRPHPRALDRHSQAAAVGH